MRRFGRLTGLGVLFVGCGGATPAPPKASPPASGPPIEQPLEKADLSPVAAPAALFVVGRLKRPGPITDTLGKWAGLPTSLRSIIGQEFRGLDGVIAWDAPIELAVALPSSGRRNVVSSAVSVGVSSLGDALGMARSRGLSPERIQPEVFGFAAGGVHCAVGPALGSASARLVCGDRAAEVEELFPYMTRGLPNENLGARDLEVELRADPIRKRFSSEIAGTRLLAGFFLRQIELDDPRFDRALADATYGVADELVLEVEDSDSLKLGGSLDETNQLLSFELAWKFRLTRSWLAGFVNDLSQRASAPPPAFARLPGDATSAGYSVELGSARVAPLAAAVAEIADAYLEHEKVGKKARGHAKGLLAKLLGFTAARVTAKGNLASAKQSDVERRLGWRVTRVEQSPREIEAMFNDLHALVGDRELYKIIAKRFELDPKGQPKSELVPLKGKGVPPGARSLTLTIPPLLTEELQKGTRSRMKIDAKQPIKVVIVTAPDGKAATVVVASSDKKDATERLVAFLGEGGKRVGARGDIGALQSARAFHGEFFTLLGLFDTWLGEKTQKAGAVLPNHGETPIIETYTALPGPPLVLSASYVIPAGAFADAPALATGLFDPF